MTVINKKFIAPALPTAPQEYDPRHIDQLNYALRLYFNLIDNYLANLTTLLNTGKTFDNIDAATINAGTVTAGNYVGGDALLGYVDAHAVGAQAGRFSGLMANSAVIKDVMANNFYGGMFYGDGRFISTPYNQFTSDQDQTGAVATATAVTFNTDDFPDSISIASNSRITFGQQGIYLLNYSLAFVNPTNDAQDIDIWYRYKGTDIANSNSKFSIPARKSAGSSSYLIAVTPYMIDVTANNDYVELMFRVSDASVALEHLNAVTASPGVTPAIPATPSAILTVQFISAQYPPTTRVAPAPVFGFGEVGSVNVVTT